MISQAKNSGVYNQVLREDARKISLATGAADLVFSNSAIEHIQDIDQVLKEVGRVLKPGGFLLPPCPAINWESIWVGGNYTPSGLTINIINIITIIYLIFRNGKKVNQIRTKIS